MTQHDTIAVVDFGGQYAHLIATKVRRLHVHAEIIDPLSPLDALGAVKGIILSGSPSRSSFGEGADYTAGLLDLPIPILGLCFGHQEIAKHYGGSVAHERREYGYALARVVADSPIFSSLGPDEIVWMSHGDSVTALPPGFREIAYSVHAPKPLLETAGARSVPPGVPTADEGADYDRETIVTADAEHRNAAIADESRKRYGLQFHPEVDDTEHGDAILANFALRICGCRPTWTVSGYADEQIAAIRARAGDGKVFLLASGGVDSTVCARVLIQALGADRVHLLHIDNGLMRKGESARVIDRFRSWGVTANLHFVDASDQFLKALAGLVDPEDKRVAIGTTFIEVCQAEMARLGVSTALLAQGTIYPDTIETGGTERADVIKTHHNRVPIVKEMIKAGRVIEPLRDLYKVEVRELGASLGLSRDLLDRHPFPGPGLGVRLLCSDGRSGATQMPHGRQVRASAGDTAQSQRVAGGHTAQAHDMARELAEITQQAQRLAAQFNLGARAIPIRSVGVKGDLRSYEWPVFLCGASEWPAILEAANRIYSEVDGVNRCCYDLAGRSSVAPEFAPVSATVTRERLDLLREADAEVMSALERFGLMEEVWQCPTVMLPVSVNGRGHELIVVRPVLSERAMTARPAWLPDALVERLRARILSLPDVSGLCLDVTTKPPGTIEWE